MASPEIEIVIKLPRLFRLWLIPVAILRIGFPKYEWNELIGHMIRNSVRMRTNSGAWERVESENNEQEATTRQ